MRWWEPHIERRELRLCLVVIVGVWVIVAAYAILHDQYLVRIAPEHFTVYHPNPLGIQSPPLLAAYWGFLGSIGPGFLLGIGLFCASQTGPLPRLRPRTVLKGTVAIVIVTEVASAIVGVVTHVSGRPLYPQAFYPPDGQLDLMVAQSIQVTAYLAGGVSGVVLICLLVHRRWRMRTCGSS